MLVWCTLAVLLGSAQSFNYFNLVRQWTPNMCYKASRSCRAMPSALDHWTIHGLWPSYNPDSWPEDCSNNCVLKTQTISHLLTQLKKEWPTSYNGGDYGFWRHEYCKHGTCASPVLSGQANYFSGTLALHKKFDIDQALDDANITPSAKKAYRVSNFDAAFKSAFGVTRVVYWCRWARDNDGVYRQLLWQVGLCISRGLKAVNCPKSDDGICNRNKQVFYLPYSVL